MHYCLTSARRFILSQISCYTYNTLYVSDIYNTDVTPWLVHKHLNNPTQTHVVMGVVLGRTQSTSYPQHSLLTVSELCGRTGSDRMDCCVIDFNLESAACCFFPPSFIARTLLAQATAPPGDIPDCNATDNTFKQGRGPGVWEGAEPMRAGLFLWPISHSHTFYYILSPYINLFLYSL